MKTVTYNETKWKLVPVEPTPEMYSAWLAGKDNTRHFWNDVYKAMLAAAPMPTPIGTTLSGRICGYTPGESKIELQFSHPTALTGWLELGSYVYISDVPMPTPVKQKPAFMLSLSGNHRLLNNPENAGLEDYDIVPLRTDVTHFDGMELFTAPTPVDRTSGLMRDAIELISYIDADSHNPPTVEWARRVESRLRDMLAAAPTPPADHIPDATKMVNASPSPLNDKPDCVSKSTEIDIRLILNAVIEFVNSDAGAATYQSVGQYRSTLQRILRGLLLGRIEWVVPLDVRDLDDRLLNDRGLALKEQQLRNGVF
ncbi:hypothetical protein L1889_18010 [Paenalcaligenes niemegkensis]|uniref:hypothetical protein n=1 Tax=Paenalcaligenes niemegkensis TaxID=2895469 RepID=UPI001EE8F7F4|nr:hypothetical protein [Paenalcaligenes niemegkensis]MCQ9618335.1 hypothetical protein [Paenalcaligenes niemegkensis]